MPNSRDSKEYMASPERIDEIAGKTVQGSLYSGVAAVVTFMLGFVRAVILARLLLPEHFGVMTLALFFVGLFSVIRYFGLNEAFIHHQNSDESLKTTYFSLRFSLNVLRTGILLVFAPILQHLYPQMAQLGDVLIVLAIIFFVVGLNMVQVTFMYKELAFFSLAVTDVVSSVVMTLVAPFGAWLGWGVWALVAEVASDTFTRFLFTWGPFRRWRPRFGWDRQSLILFWKFGKPTWVKTNVNYLLDRFDDFWIGSALGQNPLGYYTKAYYFAGAPRRVFAIPLFKVFIPVFARLQRDRERLSYAFFRCAHLLIRVVFLGAGLFALIMPEFILRILGEKWLPMLWTFRLLLMYAVFDSLWRLINGLFIAVGKPKVLRNATLVQAVFFIPAVMLGAHLAGINGVAIAADGMLFIGIWCIYRPLVETIDFPIWRLFGWPILALIAAFGVGIALESVVYASLWQLLFLKVGIFVMVFGGILMLVEGKDYLRDMKEVWEKLKYGTMK
jgi:O-antigen/teichoic acid export membrane protein